MMHRQQTTLTCFSMNTETVRKGPGAISHLLHFSESPHSSSWGQCPACGPARPPPPPPRPAARPGCGSHRIRAEKEKLRCAALKRYGRGAQTRWRSCSSSDWLRFRSSGTLRFPPNAVVSRSETSTRILRERKPSSGDGVWD